MMKNVYEDVSGEPGETQGCAPQQEETSPRVTRVGRAYLGGNAFRGYDVEGELLGQTSLWKLLLLAMDVRQLEPWQEEVLDAVAVSSTAADPRIWPLKTTRVAGAYGGLWSAFCSALVLNDGASVGSSACMEAARFLQKAVEQVTLLGEERLEEAVEVAVAHFQGRVLGFGVACSVAGRVEDERSCMFERWFARWRETHTQGDWTHWDTLQKIRSIILQKHGLQVNILIAYTAIALDVGLTPDQTVMMGFIMLLPSYLANAYEGTHSTEGQLPEHLPTQSVRYVGKPIAPRQQGEEP